ncbi:MAG: hypothetical protein DRR08_14320 [Candidatus Parabeggiatoa sp. nov. 2]|nr:MAG: hypothetical protein B6247_18105 [Beggiatoa sp. 4572_84]RKZ59308.1 MAG: hypothetical protein DRR08_14320 [Gammaproteobacteria bacterium]
MSPFLYHTASRQNRHNSTPGPLVEDRSLLKIFLGGCWKYLNTFVQLFVKTKINCELRVKNKIMVSKMKQTQKTQKTQETSK